MKMLFFIAALTINASAQIPVGGVTAAGGIINPFIVSSTANAASTAPAVTTGMNTTGATLLTLAISSFSNDPDGSASIVDAVGGNAACNNVGGGPPAWTPFGTSYASGSNVITNLFYCTPAHTGAGHTVTVTGLQFPAVVFTAWNIKTTLDVVNGAGSSGSVTTLSSGSSGSPAGSGELFITGYGSNGTSTGALSVNSGWTIPTNGTIFNGANGNTSLNTGIAWQIGGAGALTGTWTDTGNSTTMTAFVVAFK
jgi:hypothetical protein